MQWKVDAHMCTGYIFSSSPHMIFVEFSKKNQKLKGFDRMTSCRTRENFNLSASQSDRQDLQSTLLAFVGIARIRCI